MSAIRQNFAFIVTKEVAYGMQIFLRILSMIVKIARWSHTHTHRHSHSGWPKLAAKKTNKQQQIWMNVNLIITFNGLLFDCIVFGFIITHRDTRTQGETKISSIFCIRKKGSNSCRTFYTFIKTKRLFLLPITHFIIIISYFIWRNDLL